MIINHKYKFIFIKSFKTAGTSTEIALSKFCDKNDIITPIIKEDELIRTKLNYAGAQNYEGMDEHMSASNIKKKIDSNIFNNYFKFINIRNPFEQIISAFYFHNESKKNDKKFLFFRKKPKKFNVFFKIKAQNIFEDAFNGYTENDKVIVDYFIRFENLKKDLTKVSELLKLPENLHDVFKDIKAKKDITPTGDKRIKLDNEHVKKVYKLANKIISLHN